MRTGFATAHPKKNNPARRAAPPSPLAPATALPSVTRARAALRGASNLATGSSAFIRPRRSATMSAGKGPSRNGDGAAAAARRARARPSRPSPIQNQTTHRRRRHARAGQHDADAGGPGDLEECRRECVFGVMNPRAAAAADAPTAPTRARARARAHSTPPPHTLLPPPLTSKQAVCFDVDSTL